MQQWLIGWLVSWLIVLSRLYVYCTVDDCCSPAQKVILMHTVNCFYCLVVLVDVDADVVDVASFLGLKAYDARDALAKAFYGQLFNWLVATINTHIRCEKKEVKASVGVLDIFGFECFEHNRCGSWSLDLGFLSGGRGGRGGGVLDSACHNH